MGGLTLEEASVTTARGEESAAPPFLVAVVGAQRGSSMAREVKVRQRAPVAGRQKLSKVGHHPSDKPLPAGFPECVRACAFAVDFFVVAVLVGVGAARVSSPSVTVVHAKVGFLPQGRRSCFWPALSTQQLDQGFET